MRNLATTTIEELRVHLPNLPISTIKSMIKGCAEAIAGLRCDKGTAEAKMIKDAMLSDLLRKETILTGELTKRGYHTHKDSADLMKWRNEGMGKRFI